VAASGQTPTPAAPTTLQQPPMPSTNSQPATVPGRMTPQAIFQHHINHYCVRSSISPSVCKPIAFHIRTDELAPW
jgi:hypothetical protein